MKDGEAGKPKKGSKRDRDEDPPAGKQIAALASPQNNQGDKAACAPPLSPQGVAGEGGTSTGDLYDPILILESIENELNGEKNMPPAGDSRECMGLEVPTLLPLEGAISGSSSNFQGFDDFFNFAEAEERVIDI